MSHAFRLLAQTGSPLETVSFEKARDAALEYSIPDCAVDEAGETARFLKRFCSPFFRDFRMSFTDIVLTKATVGRRLLGGGLWTSGFAAARKTGLSCAICGVGLKAVAVTALITSNVWIS